MGLADHLNGKLTGWTNRHRRAFEFHKFVHRIDTSMPREQTVRLRAASCEASRASSRENFVLTAWPQATRY